jgi:hypothetical protein
LIERFYYILDNGRDAQAAFRKADGQASMAYRLKAEDARRYGATKSSTELAVLRCY